MTQPAPSKRAPLSRWNPFHADWQGVLAEGWRSPQILLLIFAASIPLAFETWMTLINNFAVERAGFDGFEKGVQESIREVPGFLAFTVVFMLLIWRQQTFAILALAVMGLGVALTGFFPTVWGIWFTTIIMSTGFHYLATMEQSLSMQWTSKEMLPVVLGRMAAVAAFASLLSYGLIWASTHYFEAPYWAIFLIAGLAAMGLAVVARTAFPTFPEAGYQKMTIVLRKRYGLYYALEFFSGGRRQIFVAFAAFLMVEKFGYEIQEIALLFAVNQLVSMWIAPKVGRYIIRWGERPMLILEYVGLIGIFTAYAFVESATIAAGLYIVDHLFFALAIAIKSYFRKIADPADISSTAGVSFTINHIAAVTMPWMLGLVWIGAEDGRMWVFLIGTCLAMGSLAMALMIPRNPAPGNETVMWKSTAVQPAE